MNACKKYLKTLRTIALFACLLFSAKHSYHSTLPNVFSEQQYAGDLKIIASSNTAQNQAADFAPLNTTIKTTKKRIQSDREKYEAFLQSHPFNKRIHEVNDKEIEREVGEE